MRKTKLRLNHFLTKIIKTYLNKPKNKNKRIIKQTKVCKFGDNV